MIAGTERRRQGCSLQDGKQWGINTGGAVRTSTLPIPFTNVFLAVASTSSEWCCPGCSATNTTVTTRAYQSNRPDVAQPNDVNWIIIGCQPQWGLGSPSINFPIAFPKECFIAAITRAAGNYEHSIVITTKNKTNLSWICKGYDNSAGNTYANWLALGCQLQWGMTVNQATTFTYPIAFSSNNVLAFKQAKSNSNGNNYLMREAGIGIPNNISVSLPGTSPALSFYVFVIGW